MKLTLMQIENEFKRQNYIANENILYAVFTALALDKPLLVDITN